MTMAPRILIPQGHSRAKPSTVHQQNLSVEQQRLVCVCSWKCPDRGFQEEP